MKKENPFRNICKMSSQFQSYSQVNYSNDISRTPPGRKEVKNKNVEHNNESKNKEVNPEHKTIYKRIRDIFKRF